LYTKYSEELHVVIVYIIEPHPSGSISPYSDKEWPLSYSKDQEGNSIFQPQTYDERLVLAQKTIKEQGIECPVLVDEMDNPIWCTYGQAPNMAYLIRSDGKIIVKQIWNDPLKIEEFILAYIIRN
jgi:hypothetical protein